MENIFQKLKPQQHLVKILFGEVKLKKAAWFTDNHIGWHSLDKKHTFATSALDFKLICHYGDAHYILRTDSAAGIKGKQLKDRLTAVCCKVKEKDGILQLIEVHIHFKVVPRMHILSLKGIILSWTMTMIMSLRTIKKNCNRELTKELTFRFEDTVYLAC